MVGKILKEHQHKIESVTLIPSQGGVFELEVGGNLIYSKKATERHAEWSDVEGPLQDLFA